MTPPRHSDAFNAIVVNTGNRLGNVVSKADANLPTAIKKATVQGKIKHSTIMHELSKDAVVRWQWDTVHRRTQAVSSFLPRDDNKLQSPGANLLDVTAKLIRQHGHWLL